MKKGTVYCVCANTLEIKGSGIRVEGLTLLPPGEEFVLLSRFTFGLFPDDEGQTIEAIATNAASNLSGKLDVERKEKLKDCIMAAVSFHFSAIELGESLECYPDKVAELLAIFDRVDKDDLKLSACTLRNSIQPHTFGTCDLFDRN